MRAESDGMADKHAIKGRGANLHWELLSIVVQHGDKPECLPGIAIDYRVSDQLMESQNLEHAIPDLRQAPALRRSRL